MKPRDRSGRSAPTRVPLLLLACVLAFPAVARVESGQAQLDRLLAGRIEGKASSCLPLFDRSDSQTIDGVGMAFRSGRTVWLSRFDEGCRASSTDTIVTSTPSSHLCRGDIARLFDQMTHMDHGACVFGDFVPYTKAKSGNGIFRAFSNFEYPAHQDIDQPLSDGFRR